MTHTHTQGHSPGANPLPRPHWGSPQVGALLHISSTRKFHQWLHQWWYHRLQVSGLCSHSTHTHTSYQHHTHILALQCTRSLTCTVANLLFTLAIVMPRRRYNSSKANSFSTLERSAWDEPDAHRAHTIITYTTPQHIHNRQARFVCYCFMALKLTTYMPGVTTQH